MTESLSTLTRRTLDDFLASLPPDQQQTVAEAFAALLASDVAAGAIGVGDEAPDFSLPGVRGDAFNLRTRLEQGPVVLSFYRGSWCPFCNLELNALQSALPDIRACGASLVAVSPELPDLALGHAEKLALDFDVLTDGGNQVADRYGLVMTVPESLRPLYLQWGIDLPAANGDDSHRLPVPATYVIDSSGVVRAAHVEKDYTQRMEPDAILDALRALPGRQAV